MFSVFFIFLLYSLKNGSRDALSDSAPLITHVIIVLLVYDQPPRRCAPLARRAHRREHRSGDHLRDGRQLV